VSAIQAGRLPAEQIERVSAQQAREEEIFLGLRQLSGINLNQIESAYAASLSEKLSSLQSAGLIEREGSIVRLAAKKLSISNEVFVELLS
jgi:oxygen-independent coproporphyrinogen-3 oxidase